MGLFKNLKQVKDAMSPGAIRQGLEASREAAQGGYAGPTAEQLASLTPEQRAAYDESLAQAARGRAEAEAAHREFHDREVARRALLGPAGEYVYGPLPDAELPNATVEDALAASKAQLQDVLRNPLGLRKPKPPPTAPLAHGGGREEQAAAERAARDAARAAYLDPARAPLRLSRLATRAKTQVDEVAAYLGSSGLAARPDLVYGVYRVPDHIGGGMIGRSGSRVVEWDVVHAAAEELPPASAAATAGFDADERWVRRRPGEPAVADEDLALDYLMRAGLGPEQCLGIARTLEIASHGGSENSGSWTVTRVTGVHAFHPAGLGSGAFEGLRADRPVLAPPLDGVRIDQLNWGAIAKAVQPASHRPFTVPSPFPHLPSTPQELLRAYLEIVGVRPSDCYSAQVTEDRPRDLNATVQKGIFTLTTNRGEDQPCADGEMRPRLAGGSTVIVAYRDRAEYEEGRARWAGYEREVLDAALAHGTRLREPVVGLDFLERGAIGRFLRGANELYEFVEGIPGDDPFEKIPPYRYCWPLDA